MQNKSILILLLFFTISVLPQNVKRGELLSSRLIADNFIKLHPDSIIYKDEAKSRNWNYEQGLMMLAFYEMWIQSGKNEYLNYIKKNLDYYIAENGLIKSYKIEHQNLDNISPGRALLNIYNLTKQDKYKKASDTLREQLRRQPRTKVGGFWHKKIYPNQMWLDGLYMAEPFYSQYALLYGEEKSFDDIANQFILCERYLKDQKTGLYYHGWDESKEQKWADPKTGTSPCFWGRAMGWYLMALMDVLDYFPQDHPKRNDLLRILRELSSNLLHYRDPKFNLWYQVIDKGKEKGNFIETSASLMIVYAYAKGFNEGYLTKSYYDAARQSFSSLQKHFITTNEGSFYLTNVCAGAGLGGNPYRNGTYNYYINEVKRNNDFKGYGPLLLASLELEKGSAVKFKNRKVGLDYYYNNEYKKGKRFHYVWEDTAYSGFSELKNIIERTGAGVDSVVTPPTLKNLRDIDVYIIVDPDTPNETASPNYINTEAIENITEWVNKGGVLLLLANDSANCEFTNLNKLADKFGIYFNGDSKNRVIGKNYDLGKFNNLPGHPIFKDVKNIYLKETSTIRLSKEAKPVLEQKGNIFMASCKYGKGFVFAVGDPWLYNEYIDNRKLPDEFDNYLAAENLFTWLLIKTKNK